MDLASIARRLGSAYLSATASCAVAHNLGDPLAAIDLGVFQEASKTGGVATVLAVVFVAWQAQTRKDAEIDAESSEH